MSKENKILPELRITEFVSHGEWNYELGNVLFDQISNKEHNSDLPILAITQENGAIPRELINYNVIVSDQGIENYKVVEVGDFIISLRSFQGGIEYSNFKGICSPAYVILRKKNSSSIEEFYKHYFKTDLFIRHLNKNLEGIRDGKMVSYKQFSEILLPNPNPKEQRKIADLLSSVDVLIAKQIEKLNALKDHKKGLMQNLFPQDGQSVPKFRFKNFTSNEEWSTCKLGDITTVVSKRNKNGDVLPIYSINNKRGFIPQSEQFENLDSNKRGYDITSYKIIESKTFAYNPARIDVGSIGYSGELNKIIVSSLYVCFKLDESVESEFLLQFFNTRQFNQAVKNNVEGGIRSYLFYENFSKIEIKLPRNKKEQLKIAMCLLDTDILIENQLNKIEQLKSHKKGLIQQLFPQPNND